MFENRGVNAYHILSFFIFFAYQINDLLNFSTVYIIYCDLRYVFYVDRFIDGYTVLSLFSTDEIIEAFIIGTY